MLKQQSVFQCEYVIVAVTPCVGVWIEILRNLSNFEVFLMTLKRGFVDIIMDKESDYDDDIEPEEKPEWSLG